MNNFLALTVILIICFFCFSFVSAQEKDEGFNLDNLTEIWQKIFEYGQKIWNGIKKVWAEKTGDRVKEWWKKEWLLIKEEFNKEIEEMKKDISDIFHGKFYNFKFWQKIWDKIIK